MTYNQILEAAATVLLFPGVWIQDHYALDDTGQPVGFSQIEDLACSVCAIGAVSAYLQHKTMTHPMFYDMAAKLGAPVVLLNDNCETAEQAASLLLLFDAMLH